jgi:dihydroneopterin aldolase
LDRLRGLDKIAIRGIDVLGHHGVDEAEREVGQRLNIDLDIYLDLSEAVARDDIHKTINYEAV